MEIGENTKLIIRNFDQQTVCEKCKKPLVTPEYFTSLEETDSYLNNGYYDKFFIELKRIGRGHSGQVFLCRHVLDGIDLGSFAVKAVPTGNNHEWLVKMLREVLLLGKLTHPNIVAYKHAWVEERQLSIFSPKVPCLFILMELANGGNLEEYLVLGEEVDLVERRRSRSTSKNLTSIRHDRINAFEHGGISRGLDGKRIRFLRDLEIKSFLNDITQGLLHLHIHSIIHRDLKPPNLLLSFDDSIPRVMISDFGECQLIDSLDVRTGATGTLEFLAPEMLMKDIDGSWLPSSSTKGDIWSLGVVLYFLCYSKVPYKSLQIDDLKREIIEFDVDKLEFEECGRVDQQVIDLMKMLMSYNIGMRPGIEEVVELVKNFQPKKRSRSLSTTFSSGISSGSSKSVDCTSLVRCHSPGEECKSVVKSYDPILPKLRSSAPINCTSLVTTRNSSDNLAELAPLLEKDLEKNELGQDSDPLKLKAELCLLFLPLFPLLLFDTPQKFLTFGSCLIGLFGFIYKPAWKIMAFLWVMSLILFRFIY